MTTCQEGLVPLPSHRNNYPDQNIKKILMIQQVNVAHGAMKWKRACQK